MRFPVGIGIQKSVLKYPLKFFYISKYVFDPAHGYPAYRLQVHLLIFYSFY